MPVDDVLPTRGGLDGLDEPVAHPDRVVAAPLDLHGRGDGPGVDVIDDVEVADVALVGVAVVALAAGFAGVAQVVELLDRVDVAAPGDLVVADRYLRFGVAVRTVAFGVRLVRGVGGCAGFGAGDETRALGAVGAGVELAILGMCARGEVGFLG